MAVPSKAEERCDSATEASEEAAAHDEGGGSGDDTEESDYDPFKEEPDYDPFAPGVEEQPPSAPVVNLAGPDAGSSVPTGPQHEDDFEELNSLIEMLRAREAEAAAHAEAPVAPAAPAAASTGSQRAPVHFSFNSKGPAAAAATAAAAVPSSSSASTSAARAASRPVIAAAVSAKASAKVSAKASAASNTKASATAPAPEKARSTLPGPTIDTGEDPRLRRPRPQSRYEFNPVTSRWEPVQEQASSAPPSASRGSDPRLRPPPRRPDPGAGGRPADPRLADRDGVPMGVRRKHIISECEAQASQDARGGHCDFQQALAVRLALRFESRPTDMLSTMAEAGLPAAKDQRSTVKALMRLCHPDKCRHPEAKRAMQILGPLLV